MPTNRWTLLLFLLAWSLVGFAQIRLPRLISDGMVLQREQNLKIWGWAAPQENINLRFKDKNYRSKADQQGNWSITLPPQAAGGPFELSLKGSNELIVRDVYFGDVWICAGQSNMVLPMERVKERYMADIEQANYPAIRNFFIPTLTNVQGPQADLPSGKWEVATPQNVMSFGSASYFFAKTIYDKYKVPIGLINASVGGTPIEAWISEAGLQNFPDLLATIQQNKDTSYVNGLNRKARQGIIPRPSADKGMLEAVKWFDPAYTPKNWRNINVPGEAEFKNKGVAYCPHCDGPLFKGKRVAVIGGGNSGVEAAIDLAGLVAHVTLIEYDTKLRADEVLQRKLRSLPNVTVITNAQTTEITGDQKVNGLRYKDRTSGAETLVDLEGVFVQIGLVPNTDWLKGTVELSKHGEIVVDAKGQTSVPGVFAAGDATTTPFKQIIIAAGDGAKAALGAFDHLIRSAVPA